MNDQEARTQALDIKNSFVVSAPAGSGKTQLLIKRYLKLLGTAKSIDSIICLTYTNKATEEMRERVVRAIELCKNQNPKDDNERELFEIAKKVYENKNIKEIELKNPHSFHISTFHSFCTNIIKNYPSDDTISTFSTLDEDEAESIYSITADIVISKAIEEKDCELFKAVARKLVSLDEKHKRLKEQIKSLLKNRDRLLTNIFNNGEPKKYVNLLLKELSKSFIEFFRQNRTNFRDILQYTNQNTRNALYYIADINLDNFKNWIDIAEIFLTQGGTPRKKFADHLAQMPDNLKNFIRNLPSTVASELYNLKNLFKDNTFYYDEQSFSDLLTIFKESLKVLKTLLSANKKDFVELELSALKNLEWLNGFPTDVLQKMQFKIDHILVDETQDLSDIEYKIISKLIEGWENNDGRTLFFVGDPKQSIYRFRKANVALFSILQKQGIVREGESDYKLIPLELQKNFRSEPQIIDFVNKTFQDYFSENYFKDDTEYTPFYHPIVQPSEDIEISINRVDFNKKISIVASENFDNVLNCFSETISKLSKKTNPDETIGILFRTRSQFIPYREKLLSAGIDIEVIEGEELISSYAVKHTFNLLKAILFPSEDLYWLLLLGSPFINLSQKEIYEVSKQEKDDWFQKVTESPLLDEKKRKIFLQMTKDFYLEKGGINFINHFEEIDGYSSLKKIYGLKGVEECQEFFRILNSIAHLSPPQLIEKMSLLLERRYSLSDPLAKKKKVQALTIHKSKGLEFDYVIVVGVDKGFGKLEKRDPEPILIERLFFDEEKRGFVFFSTPYEKNEISYKILSQVGKIREESEYKRLYYVALTRAKKGLFLFGKLNKNNSLPKDSILKVISEKNNSLNFSALIELEERETIKEKKDFDINLKPPNFLPEKIPFKIERASEEVEISQETFLFRRSSNESLKFLRSKGTVIHKILEFFAKGRMDIDINYVEKLFKEMWVNPNNNFAIEVLKETKRAWNLEVFKEMREGGEIFTEFPLEMNENRSLIVGRIDLLIKKLDGFIAIDYKTSKPDNDKLENWIEREVDKYKSQMEIYKKMVSNFEKIEEDKIQFYLLFTYVPLLKRIF